MKFWQRRSPRISSRSASPLAQVFELERRELLAADAAAAIGGEVTDSEAAYESVSPTVADVTAQDFSNPAARPLTDTSAPSAPVELVFIDSAVDDFEQFITPSMETAQVVLLDGTQNAIAQITDTILNTRHVKAVHIISHGDQGALLLGKTRIDTKSLDEHASLLGRWAESLVHGADILVYGCETGATHAGRTFIGRLAKLTGADVAASINPTGNEELGADWNLEYQVTSNSIQTPVLRPGSNYRHTLALPNFVNFSDVSSLSLNGSANRNGNALELTPDRGGLGSAFFNEALTVNQDTSFQTQFQIRMGDGDGSNGADGMTFLLQNAPTGLASLSSLGGGSGLGIGGLTNSLAIVFDTYKNNHDLDNNHISIVLNGDIANPLAEQTAPIDLNSGQRINVWVDYNGVNQSLAVFLSADAVKPIDPVLVSAVDLTALVGSQAFMGFTAATGSLTNRHEVLAWRLNTQQPALPPPQGILGMAVSQMSFNESQGEAILTVLRRQGASGVVEVDYATFSGTATQGVDFQGVAGTLRFEEGETSKQIVIPLLNDTLFESDESFLVVLSNPTNGAELAEVSQTTVTIQEDNANLPTFANFFDSTRLALNGTASIQGNALQLTPAGGGLGSAFYNRALTVTPDTSFKTDFSFRIRDGQGTGGADGFVFMLQNSAGGYTALTNTGGAGLGYAGILNSLAVEFDTYKNSFDPDNNHLSVLLNGNVSAPLVTAPVNLDLNSGQVLYAWVEYNGPRNQLKVYLANEDRQPDESLLTVEVDLAALVGNRAILGFSAATGGLVNRHEILSWNFNTEQPLYAPAEGIVGFEVTQQTVSENAREITVEVKRQRGSVGTVSVDYETLAQSAAEGVDFVNRQGTLTFAPGETTKQITIELIDDLNREPPESFRIVLANPSGGASLGNESLLVNIADEDVRLPSYSNFFSASHLTFNGQSVSDNGQLLLTTAMGGMGSVFADDAIPIKADTSFQTQFQFKIDGGNGPGGADGMVFMLQNSPTGRNALASNSGGSLGYAGIANSLAIEFDTFRNEYDPNNNHIAVLRDGNVLTPIAKSSTDSTPAIVQPPFDLNSGEVISVWIDYDGQRNLMNVYASQANFKPLAPLLTVEVDLSSIVGDQAYAGFSAAYGGLSNVHRILNWQFQTANLPSPPAAGVVGLSANQFVVDENADQVSVDVLRALGTEGTVTVQYRTVSGFANESQDFEGQTGTLVFAPGETVKAIVIPILNDSLAEARESFQVSIDDVTGGATLLAPRTATITIIDEDSKLPQFPQFNSSSGLTLNGSASVIENSLVLTPNFGGIGSAFFADPILVNSLTSFQTQFSFQVDQGDGAGGADGLVFMLQNSEFGPTALSTIEGKGLGYWRIGNSLGIEFDTFKNDWDLNGNHVSVFANGNMDVGASLGTAVVPFNLKTGAPVYAWVDYNGGAEQLSVYLSQNQTKPDLPVLVVENVDLAALVGDQAYAGFSAATGGLVNRHQILNWRYNTSVPAVISPSTGVQASNQVVASGFMLPTSIAWSPNGQNLYVAEKSGVVRIIRNGAPATVFLDISSEVNSYGDRGLTAVAVHPDLENNPYVYLFYSYDPPEVYQHLGNANAGPDGSGNRASRLVRVTADVNTNYTTAVPGSEVVILGTNSVWENYNGFVDSTTDLAEPPGGLVTNGSRSDFNGYVILPNGETALAPSANRLPDGGAITFANIRDFIAADSVAHSSADVKFGPDGALYVSIGDGASYNERDPRGLRVQDLDNLSGKILRIDPLTGAGLTDNPFYTGDPTANRSKVYQSGFRNPFRIAISPQGQVYSGDVGWTTWEEINTGGPGANFGWPYFEGGNGVNLPTTGYQNLPVAQSFYASGGEAISSFVGLNHGVDGINALILSDYYTGTAYGPDYVGSLFFNDLGRGLVRNVMLDANGRVAGIRSFASNATFVVSIHQGPDGFLYFVDIDDGLVGRWVI